MTTERLRRICDLTSSADSGGADGSRHLQGDPAMRWDVDTFIRVAPTYV